MSLVSQDDLNFLSVVELQSLARNHLFLGGKIRNKDAIVTHILQYASDDLLLALKHAVDEKLDVTLKHKSPTTFPPDRDYTRYLELPENDRLKYCYANFYKATGNDALHFVVCAVCARGVNVEEDKVVVMPLSEIPKPSRLIPRTSHPAHDLWNRALLEPAGFVSSICGLEKINICGSCLSDLENSSLTLPPPYSLANNMWIGRVPWQLQILTFPEQILIALLFPRVYVFKLYPKLMHSVTDMEGLQRGLRGNVSTFKLDSNGIACMLEGNLMPRTPLILSSIISVTYIGRGRLPKRWLQSTFRVRRHVVVNALLWLKKNNPKYYRAIEISEHHLSMLPEDDIPVEILGSLRQSDDVDVITKESAGYTNADCWSGEMDSENDNSPDVIPLQVSGSTDCDMTQLTAKDVMSWAMLNMWSEGEEGLYAVRHGRKPAADFAHISGTRDEAIQNELEGSNYFEKAFPCLFPYGRGGVESICQPGVLFNDHIKWCLQYHDRRFRTHETFPFLAFDISQRRQALMSAHIQMQRKDFERHARIMSAITLQDLHLAQQQEERKLRVTHPGILLMKKHLVTMCGRVKGSDISHQQLRSKIWSTNLRMGPPSLWITINPSDLHDPIAQVLAGEEINLDDFIATSGPNKKKCRRNIARDPYAAAKFFRFIISAMFEHLFQCKASKFQFTSSMGVLGKVSAYFGTVESQGRGTLHLHLLIWLRDTPSHDEMVDLLKTAEFRKRITSYIQANLRAYVPGLESAESIKQIPRDTEIAYSRPPNPASPTYAADLENFEIRLARTEQIHTCKPRQCLYLSKDGTYRCKRRAPFPCSAEDSVDEEGRWCQKHLYGYVNGWVTPILLCGRCNNDGKLLTNARDTRNITFYVTSYAAKKQGKNYNLSAIMADGFTYHLKHPNQKYIDILQDNQRMLLFRLVHSVNREQEIAGPMVISYLMDWNDTFCSHSYTPLYWSSFSSYLIDAHPELRGGLKVSDNNSSIQNPPSNDINVNLNNNTCIPQAPSTSEKDVDDTAGIVPSNEDTTPLYLGINCHGRIYAKSQVTDYQLRGDHLSNMSMFDFFTHTYDTRARPRPMNDNNNDTENHPPKVGRPRNLRVAYLPSHPTSDSSCRIIRSENHHNIPNIVGNWFPDRSDTDRTTYYAASMLMLLKPWRNICIDLKTASQSWQESLDDFIKSNPSMKYIISNIQYFHDARSRLPSTNDNPSIPTFENDASSPTDADHLELAEDMANPLEPQYTEEGLAELIASQTPWREELHAKLAIEKAKLYKLFDSHSNSWDLYPNTPLSNASGDDLIKLALWKLQMKNATTALSAPSTNLSPYDLPDVNLISDDPTVELLAPHHVQPLGPSSFLGPEDCLSTIKQTDLTTDQKCAYEIIVWHLDQTLMSRNPPPLRMIIYGEGGTGKSVVIQSVTDAFSARGGEYLLIKSSYTGIAASLIDGRTCHVIAQMSINSNNDLTPASKTKLQKIWQSARYVVIDEYSMLSKTFLAKLSKHISVGVHLNGHGDPNHSFGGINVILCGDLHQFPPVASKTSDALFYPINLTSDSTDNQLGRKIYEEFNTVVILNQQKRIRDDTWHSFLHRLRHGHVVEKDISMLRKLVIGKTDEMPPDFENEPWSSAPLVTPRHAVRKEWNQSALRKWCKQSGRQLLVKVEKVLPDTIELAVGMQVMVTSNVDTDLDLTNGARSEIIDIILHPDEPDIGNDPIVHLTYLPSYILMKLKCTRAPHLNGLEEGVVPIEVAIQNLQINIPSSNGEMKKKSVKREQFPMTGAYTFTDYRSQGQTIPYVMIDLASPPTGQLTLFNLYIALSRSVGRSSVRILRGFDDDIFKQSHDPSLTLEDEQLQKLNDMTQRWWYKINTSIT